MHHFGGIPIREQSLLIRSVGFTVLFLLALAVAGLLCGWCCPRGIGRSRPSFAA